MTLICLLLSLLALAAAAACWLRLRELESKLPADAGQNVGGGGGPPPVK